MDNNIFKKQLKPVTSEQQNLNHRKFHSAVDLKGLNVEGKDGRVDKDTIDGKKVATVKDRARLRDLIKNIQNSQ